MSDDLWFLVSCAIFLALWLPVGALTARFCKILDPDLHREDARLFLYFGWATLIALVIVGITYAAVMALKGIWDFLHWIAGAK